MHYAHAWQMANGKRQLALQKKNCGKLCTVTCKKQKPLTEERAKYSAAATTCLIAMVHSLSTTLANTAKL